MANDDPNIRLNATDNTAKAFRSVQENMRNLASSAAILEGPLGQVAGRINAFGAAIGRASPLVIGAGVALSVATIGMIKAVQAASELEQQTFKLNAVLKATQSASGLTAEAIDAYAYSLAEATLASQQGARDAAVALTSFTSVSGDQFKRTLSLAQDYVAVFGGDLSSAVVKFGRAMDNPREGLQGLSRQFTAFNAAERQVIATLYESGQIVEAQERILAGLEARIGGAGVGAAGGLAGAYDTLGERVTKFLQIAGEGTGLLSLSTKVIAGWASGLEYLNNLLSGDSPQEKIMELNASIDENTQVFNENLKIFAKGKDYFGFYKGYMDEAATAIEEEREARRLLVNQLIQEAIAANEAAKAGEEAKRRKQEEAEEVRRLADSEALYLSRLKEKSALYSSTRTPLERLNEAAAHYQVLMESNVGVTQQMVNRALRPLDRAVDDAAVSYAKLLNAATTPQDNEQERVLAEQLLYRKTAIERAFQDQEDTSIEATQRKNAALLALEQKYTQDLERLHIERGAKVAQSAASILDSVAQLYSIKSQQQSEKVNKRYDEQAQAINDQVEGEVITREEGDRRLNELEKKRQQEQRAGAKKNFENSKKLQRAAAIVNTAAGITLALSDPTTGSQIARFAAAAAVAAQGAVQLATINATTFDGGGGVGASGSAGVPVTAPRLEQQAGANGALTVQFLGDFYGWDEYMQERVISGIRDAVDNRDVTIIGNNSRQAQELRA